MSKKKILITGGNSMLAYDFHRTQSEFFHIVLLKRSECNIASFESILQAISFYEPDIVLNCAAYTAVDDAEDVGYKDCFETNTMGVYNLARATSAFGIDFITISTDYVFDGQKSEGYFPDAECNPLGAYGMSKYLGEKFAFRENNQSIVIRTSWLYGGNPFGSDTGVFKNFVNTILKLTQTKSELTVVSDQFGIPTSCVDLSVAIGNLINNIENEEYRGSIFHFSNSSHEQGIHWADFARTIFEIIGRNVQVNNCTSSEYITKAKRPKCSILKNDSSIFLPDWKTALEIYLKNI